MVGSSNKSVPEMAIEHDHSRINSGVYTLNQRDGVSALAQWYHLLSSVCLVSQVSDSSLSFQLVSLKVGYWSNVFFLQFDWKCDSISRSDGVPRLKTMENHRGLIPKNDNQTVGSSKWPFQSPIRDHQNTTKRVTEPTQKGTLRNPVSNS